MGFFSPNKRISHLQAFIFQYQTFLPGERNEHPFRNVFVNLPTDSIGRWWTKWNTGARHAAKCVIVFCRQTTEVFFRLNHKTFLPSSFFLAQHSTTFCPDWWRISFGVTQRNTDVIPTLTCVFDNFGALYDMKANFGFLEDLVVYPATAFYSCLQGD